MSNCILSRGNMFFYWAKTQAARTQMDIYTYIFSYLQYKLVPSKIYNAPSMSEMFFDIYYCFIDNKYHIHILKSKQEKSKSVWALISYTGDQGKKHF